MRQFSRIASGYGLCYFPDHTTIKSKMTNLNRVRSFVRRQGRITESQKFALKESQGILLQPEDLKGRTFDKPLIVEIGFGMGTSLCTQAVENPQYHFLGFEVYAPGLGACILQAHAQGLQNLNVISDDVHLGLPYLAPGSVQGVQIFFPDPWPKTKHHKRRLVQVEFLKLLLQVLAPGGWIRVASDIAAYAQHTQKVFSRLPCFEALPLEMLMRRPTTKYEQKALAIQGDIYDLAYQFRGNLA